MSCIKLLHTSQWALARFCSTGTGPGMLLCKLQAQCLTCLSLCVALHACGSEPHSIALSMLACSLLPACWAAWVSRALYRSCTPRFPWSGLQTWVSFRHICTLIWQWPCQVCTGCVCHIPTVGRHRRFKVSYLSSCLREDVYNVGWRGLNTLEVYETTHTVHITKHMQSPPGSI